MGLCTLAVFTRRDRLGVMHLLGAPSRWIVLHAAAAGLVVVAGGVVGAAWLSGVTASTVLRLLHIDGEPSRLLSLRPALVAGAGTWLAYVATCVLLAGRSIHRQQSPTSRTVVDDAASRAAQALLLAGAACGVGFAFASLEQVREARQVDLGFQADGLTYRAIRVPPSESPLTGVIESTAEYLSLTTSDPVGLVGTMPLSGSGVRTTVDADNGGSLSVVVNAASSSYFEVSGIKAIHGSAVFRTPRDVVVSRQAAAHWWPDQTAIGRFVRFGGVPFTVIGVVDDTVLDPVDLTASPTIYLPIETMPLPVIWAVTRPHGSMSLPISGGTLAVNEAAIRRGTTVRSSGREGTGTEVCLGASPSLRCRLLVRVEPHCHLRSGLYRAQWPSTRAGDTVGARGFRGSSGMAKHPRYRQRPCAWHCDHSWPRRQRRARSGRDASARATSPRVGLGARWRGLRSGLGGGVSPVWRTRHA